MSFRGRVPRSESGGTEPSNRIRLHVLSTRNARPDDRESSPICPCPPAHRDWRLAVRSPRRPTTSRSRLREDVVYTKVGDHRAEARHRGPPRGTGRSRRDRDPRGAWRAGNKRDVPGHGRDARTGLRGDLAPVPLLPQGCFPAQVHDVKAAVRWLRANAKEYKLDPDHIGATGFSAGGHLSLMLGVTGRSDGLEGDDVPADAPSSRVQAVVNYFGPTDLAAKDIPEVSRPLVRRFLGGRPTQKPEEAARRRPGHVRHQGRRPDADVPGDEGPARPLHPGHPPGRRPDLRRRPRPRRGTCWSPGHGWGGDEMTHTIEETFAFFDRHLKPSARP